MAKLFRPLCIFVVLLATTLACASQAPEPTSTSASPTDSPATDTPLPPSPTDTPTPIPSPTPTITPPPSQPEGYILIATQHGDYFPYSIYGVKAENLEIVYVSEELQLNSDFALPNAYSPSMSPDGKKIAFYFEDGAGGPIGQIYITNSDGSNAIATGTFGHHTWDLDSSLLIIYAQKEVWTINSDGTNLKPHPINEYPGEIIRMMTLRDGVYFLADCAPKICMLNESGEELYQMTEAQYQPFDDGDLFDAGSSPSPDGWQFLHDTKENDPNRATCGRQCEFEIYVFDVGSETLSFLATGRAPVWSQDGTKIAYVNNEGLIYVMNADGSEQTRITEEKLDFQPGGNLIVWSPDGQWLAVAGPDGLYIIRVMNGEIVSHIPKLKDTRVGYWWQP